MTDDDDCGYVAALSVLMGVGPEMAQKTPPAVGMQQAPQPMPRAMVPLPPELAEDEEPRPISRKRSRPSSSSSLRSSGEHSSSPRLKRRRSRQRMSGQLMWTAFAEREAAARFKVRDGYPDQCQSCRSLAPGTRRKVVNTIHTMASCLNLELGTPTFGILLMDRFLTAKPKAIRRDSILLVAMVCLNIAGKVADIDGGYCGSRSVLQMIRDAVPPRVRAKTEMSFMRCVYQIETLILSTMDNYLFELPPALQCVAEATRWHETDQTKWLQAALLCDIFATDTASTGVPQWEAAQAVVYIIDGDSSAAPSSKALSAVCRAAVLFLNSGAVPSRLMDPYHGARLRHKYNPTTQALLTMREAMEAMIQSDS
jgi:hypothetical protein